MLSTPACAGWVAGCVAGLFLASSIPPALAQEKPQAPAQSVTFSGVAANPDGKPKTGVAGVTFSLYQDAQGGAPLWMETQNVALDSAGGYTAQIGATRTEGLPIGLFASGQARWLEVQVDGQPPAQRVLLVSVPYALKAVDAQTLGGLPVSAFALAGTSNAVGAAPTHVVASRTEPAAAAAKPDVTGTGTASYVPLWSSSTALGNSVLYQSSANQIGIGTTSPTAEVEVADRAENGVALAGVSAGTSGTGVQGSGTAYGVVGTTNSSTGVAVRGINGATSGSTIGVYGGASSSIGSGVWGQGLATSGANYGVVGETNSADYGFGVLGNTAATGGAGVAGYATSTSGPADGVYGQNASTSGAGVYGNETATTGNANGVAGYSASATGNGVLGSATATTGDNNGVAGYSASPTGVGVLGSATATTGDNYGVAGYSASPTGVGVYGVATATTGVNYGVVGYTTSTGAGVFGTAASNAGYSYGGNFVSTGNNGGIAVQGTATATSGIAYGGVLYSASTSGIGLLASANATSGSTIGILGTELSGSGIAVFGRAGSGSTEAQNHNPTGIGPPGVWGDSSGGFGVVGTSDYTYAVAAYTGASSAPALYAENDETTNSSTNVFGTYSPHYNGYCNISVTGSLKCSGTLESHTAVDESREVAMYSVQAAENWMEDAGTSQLRSGAAVVQLDAQYALTVNTGLDYHVFLTPRGDCKGLYVGNLSPTSFEVHELGGGTASIAFDYRIMARRKGFENVRLAETTGGIDHGPTLTKAGVSPPPLPPAGSPDTHPRSRRYAPPAAPAALVHRSPPQVK
jgi:hypothetical protein